MKRFTLALGAAAMLVVPTAAQAQGVQPGDTNTPCTLTDLVGVTVLGCSGFWSGNLNSGGAGQNSNAAQNVALAALGLSTPIQILEKFDFPSQNPPNYADFQTTLYGITVVGFHWGAGVFNAQYPNNNFNSGSAFYKIDAGTQGIDKLYFSTIMDQSQSNAVLFLTGRKPDDPPGGGTEVVPEPATMTLLATGLAGMAAARRRRKQA